MSEMHLSNTLYGLYHTLVRLETQNLKDNKYCSNLTVNELNLIECIRSLTKGSEGPTISAIAAKLDITRPSTTVAVNKLENKGIATKTESKSDGRSVRVKLTAAGEKAYSAHHSFQNTLIKTAKQEMSEEEYRSLRESLCKLQDFLDNKTGPDDNM